MEGGEFKLFDDPERIRNGRRGLSLSRLGRLGSEQYHPPTPVEEEVARTVNPDQLVLEGLDIVLEDPPERGWRKKKK